MYMNCIDDKKLIFVCVMHIGPCGHADNTETFALIDLAFFKLLKGVIAAFSEN